MKQIRLDKFLAVACGITRSQARQQIRKKLVTVDGQVEGKPERKVDPRESRVELMGEVCQYEEHLYLMLHKPQGLVSATEDATEKTVLDCVDSKGRKLFPVGRLDKDTEGLLILTDDGELAHNLLAPGKHVDKTYYAVLDKEPGRPEILAFKEGLDIGDKKKTLPALLQPLGPCPGGYAVRITIREGRYHQIKRMAGAVGARVLYLKRESMGSLKLDPSLSPGQYRPLREEELQLLKVSSQRNKSIGQKDNPQLMQPPANRRDDSD